MKSYNILICIFFLLFACDPTTTNGPNLETSTKDAQSDTSHVELKPLTKLQASSLAQKIWQGNRHLEIFNLEHKLVNILKNNSNGNKLGIEIHGTEHRQTTYQFYPTNTGTGKFIGEIVTHIVLTDSSNELLNRWAMYASYEINISFEWKIIEDTLYLVIKDVKPALQEHPFLMKYAEQEADKSAAKKLVQLGWYSEKQTAQEEFLKPIYQDYGVMMRGLKEKFLTGDTVKMKIVEAHEDLFVLQDETGIEHRLTNPSDF